MSRVPSVHRLRGSAQRRAPVLAAVAVAALALFFLPVVTPPAPADAELAVARAPMATTISPANFPIDHIVVVMMENHAYDNYFGAYCGVTNSLCPIAGDGIPAGTCVPMVPTNVSAGCIKPFPLPASYVTRSEGAGHNWVTSHIAYANGSMDGFYDASHGKAAVMGYYNGTTIPTYWDTAQEYGLGDDFFSATLSYSLANHWYLLAGQSPLKAETDWLFVTKNKQTGQTMMTPADSVYLNEANQTPAIDDQLVTTNLTWKYYDDSFQNATYAQELTGTNLGLKGKGVPSVYDYWDPLAAKNETYTPAFEPHWVNRTQFQVDAAAGALPNVSWVIPNPGESDHPSANLSRGMAFVGGILNAVERSPDWNSTAVFVTWDEYGGYYDHVPPPQVNPYGLGFRVPLLVVSPYTPEGLISNNFSSFGSLLHFTEWRNGLPALTSWDANSSLPLQYFDLNATPRVPINLSVESSYPYAPQAESLHPVRNLSAQPTPTGLFVTWDGPQGRAPVADYTVDWHRRGGSKLDSLTVPREQNYVTLANPACNETGKVSVATVAGGSASVWANLTVRMPTCVVPALLPPGGPGHVFSVLAREGTIDPRRRGRGSGGMTA